MSNMNEIQGVVEKLHEGLADKTAKGIKSINNCGQSEFPPKKTVALECCKKNDESLKLFQDSPAALYPSSCFFITCIVARVFLLQCVAASKAKLSKEDVACYTAKHSDCHQEDNSSLQFPY